jgi:hypothetical protein
MPAVRVLNCATIVIKRSKKPTVKHALTQFVVLCTYLPPEGSTVIVLFSWHVMHKLRPIIRFLCRDLSIKALLAPPLADAVSI